MAVRIKKGTEYIGIYGSLNEFSSARIISRSNCKVPTCVNVLLITKCKTSKAMTRSNYKTKKK